MFAISEFSSDRDLQILIAEESIEEFGLELSGLVELGWVGWVWIDLGSSDGAAAERSAARDCGQGAGDRLRKVGVCGSDVEASDLPGESVGVALPLRLPTLGRSAARPLRSPVPLLEGGSLYLSLCVFSLHICVLAKPDLRISVWFQLFRIFYKLVEF